MLSQVRGPLPGAGKRGGIQLIDQDLYRLAPAIKKVKRGAVNLYLTAPAEAGAALSVNENCDATVRTDMLNALDRLAPASLLGAPGAVGARALLMSYPSLTLPVRDGRLSFGTWQGLYLAALGDSSGPGRGDLVVTVAEASSQRNFTFDANKRASHPMDKEVLETVGGAGAAPAGICLVHEKHTSASLGVARGDLEPAMSAAVPEVWNSEFFQHTYEGPDDMPGHMKSTLLGCAVSLPLIRGGALGLGRGQAVSLHEHRDCGGWGGGHSRSVEVTVLSGAGAATSQATANVPVAGPLTEITAELRASLAKAGVRGPGLLQVFVQGTDCGVLCAEEAACSAWAKAVEGMPGASRDPAARAALAGPSADFPFDASGELCLSPEQQVYVYAASPGEQASVPVLLTVRGASQADGSL